VSGWFCRKADGPVLTALDQREDGPATEPRELSLQEQLDAIEPPQDRYHIGQDPKTGLWWVDGWYKRIGYDHLGSPYANVAPRVRHGYERLCETLLSQKAAERWLAAHIDPAAHRTAYDAEGKRLAEEASS
jgi:hypothetical protein